MHIDGREAGRSLNFGIYGVDEPPEIAASEGVALQLARISSAGRNMIGQNAARESAIAQDAQDWEQVEHALVRIDFDKIVEASLKSRACESGEFGRDRLATAQAESASWDQLRPR